MLYSRRFFPYYAFNILAGLDSEGESVTVGVTNVKSSLIIPDTYCTHARTHARTHTHTHTHTHIREWLCVQF